MVKWISSWAESIIIAVIVATIIEMILPEGASKKYIKVVVGVYILFTIISPVVSNFTGKTLAVSDVLDINKYMEKTQQQDSTQNKLQQENAASIREIYMGNLKSDIQNKLKQKGYVVKDIQLDVANDDNYTLKQIILVVNRNSIDEQDDEDNIIDNEQKIINKVEIVNEINVRISSEDIQDKTNKLEENESSNLNNSDKKKIKEYLSSVYDINEKNIIIN